MVKNFHISVASHFAASSYDYFSSTPDTTVVRRLCWRSNSHQGFAHHKVFRTIWLIKSASVNSGLVWQFTALNSYPKLLSKLDFSPQPSLICSSITFYNIGLNYSCRKNRFLKNIAVLPVYFLQQKLKRAIQQSRDVIETWRKYDSETYVGLRVRSSIYSVQTLLFY